MRYGDRRDLPPPSPQLSKARVLGWRGPIRGGLSEVDGTVVPVVPEYGEQLVSVDMCLRFNVSLLRWKVFFFCSLRLILVLGVCAIEMVVWCSTRGDCPLGI